MLQHSFVVHHQYHCGPAKLLRDERGIVWKPKKLIKFKPVSLKSITKDWAGTPKKVQPKRISDQIRGDMKVPVSDFVQATPKKRKNDESTPVTLRPRREIVKKRFDDFVTLDSD